AGLTVCPVQGLGPRAARRARRGVGAASSQRCPRPSAPASAARSRTHFLHRWGPPPRTQVGTKRGKRSRMAGVRRSRPQAAGWAHERSMGSHREEGPLQELSQLDQDAELDDADTARPRAALLEKHPLEGEKQPPGTGQGLFFYIGGTNGASMVLKMEDFFPETYRLDIRDEREAFFTLFDGSEMSPDQWTLHPARNPLLLDGKKFDVRSYLLIACAMPYMVFFGHGYARLTLGLYDPHSSDLGGHLTNQGQEVLGEGLDVPEERDPCGVSGGRVGFMQKKSPLYLLLKDDTVWSMEHLNRYIND
ncbi:hypothetical protein E2I00_015820, partial [Balaenoptera physalus]